MTVAIGGKNVALGALLALVGGILAVVAAFLSWFSFSVTTSGSLSGQSLDGKIGVDTNSLGGFPGILVLILGIAAVALAAAWIMQVAMPNVGVPLPAIIAGVGIVGLVLLGLVYFTNAFAFHWTVTSTGIYKSMPSSTFGTEAPHAAMAEWSGQVAKFRTEISSLGSGISFSDSGGAAIGFFGEVLASILGTVGGVLGMSKKAA